MGKLRHVYETTLRMMLNHFYSSMRMSRQHLSERPRNTFAHTFLLTARRPPSIYILSEFMTTVILLALSEFQPAKGRRVTARAPKSPSRTSRRIFMRNTLLLLRFSFCLKHHRCRVSISISVSRIQRGGGRECSRFRMSRRVRVFCAPVCTYIMHGRTHAFSLRIYITPPT